MRYCILNIIINGLIFLFQILVFLCFGSLFVHFFKQTHNSIFFSLSCGFFINFALFELFALPCTLLRLPLTFLAVIWMAFSCIIVLLAIYFCRRDWKSAIMCSPKFFRESTWTLLILFASILIQMLIVFTHMDNSADASYYVGKAATDVYKNSLGLFNPYTGAELSRFNVRYLFSCFPDYNAVISKFFNLHALKQAKVIMPQIIILVTNILYYQVGMILTENNRKKSALFVFWIFLINLYSNTIYTSANFLLLRTYEGKAVLANTIITGIILCCLQIYRGKSPLFYKFLLFFITLSSVTFSSSSMLIVPLAVSAGFLTVIFIKKQYRSLGWYILYTLPNLMTGFIYLLYTKGILSFSI